jgi:hypothetical protein
VTKHTPIPYARFYREKVAPYRAKLAPLSILYVRFPSKGGSRVSVYDALYIALAAEKKLPLLTLDER